MDGAVLLEYLHNHPVGSTVGTGVVDFILFPDLRFGMILDNKILLVFSIYCMAFSLSFRSISSYRVL